jgi:hypothetical protein
MKSITTLVHFKIWRLDGNDLSGGNAGGGVSRNRFTRLQWPHRLKGQNSTCKGCGKEIAI